MPLSGSNAVARPSQGISPKHCTLPAHRAEGFWRNVIPVPMSGSKFPGPSTTARSAAAQPSVVSLPFQGDEICLAPINPALPWTTFQLEHVGGNDSDSSMGLSQSLTCSKTHWKCSVLHIDVIPSTIGENASSLPCAALSLISSRRSGMPPTHALRVPVRFEEACLRSGVGATQTKVERPQI